MTTMTTTNATTTTTSHSATDAEQLASRLWADGYRPGAPPWLTSLCRGIDREVCATSACDHCGHAGLRWEAWHRAEPQSYRAFAVCPCGHAVEF